MYVKCRCVIDITPKIKEHYTVVIVIFILLTVKFDGREINQSTRMSEASNTEKQGNRA